MNAGPFATLDRLARPIADMLAQAVSKLKTVDLPTLGWPAKPTISPTGLLRSELLVDFLDQDFHRFIVT